MRLLSPIFTLGIVVAAIYLVTRRRSPREILPERERAERIAEVEPGGRSGPPSPPAVDLSRWVAAGLLSEAQSAAILEHEQAVSLPPSAAPVAPAAVEAGRRRVPIVAEALGYLGGVLATVGLVLLVARYWPDMALSVRLALSGGAAVGLAAGGAFVPEAAEPALARFRWSLWLASTAATVLFFGVLVTDAGDVDVKTVVLACSGSAALQSGLLWAWRMRPVQQFVAFAAFAVVGGAAVAEVASPGLVGLTVWAIGATYLAIGLRRVTPLAVLVEAEGAVSLIVGGVIAASAWEGAGMLLLMATALALLVLATVPGLVPDRADVVVAGIAGGVALLNGGPGTLGFYSQEAGIATGMATWLVGGGLVFVGRRRLVRTPLSAQLLGGAGIVGGAALTGTQAQGFATAFGLLTAVGLVAFGMLPGAVVMSVFGSVGLLINVPWAISWFFPGEGRAPLLILVAGGVILVVAVLLTRMGGRFREEMVGLGERRPPVRPHVARLLHAGPLGARHRHRDVA